MEGSSPIEGSSAPIADDLASNALTRRIMLSLMIVFVVLIMVLFYVYVSRSLCNPLSFCVDDPITIPAPEVQKTETELMIEELQSTARTNEITPEEKNTLLNELDDVSNAPLTAEQKEALLNSL